MYSKSLLIAIAAFAVTTAGAQAFSGAYFAERAGLTPTQAQAFTQARDLKLKGKTEEARDILLAAGVDEEAMTALRKVAKEAHLAIHAAVAAGDFTAFKVAAAGTPLLDIITTEADFAQFKEAHALKAAGDFAAAQVIFTDLGLPAKGTGVGHGGRSAHGGLQTREALADLTDEQRDALRVARQANDRATVEKILTEAGVEVRQYEGHEDKHIRMYQGE
jgi:hypothetical protein